MDKTVRTERNIVSSKVSRFHKYLSEFVYGGIDGSVTTFAVVAGATGADLNGSVVIILGFANLIADGFSMSVGSYLSLKSDKERFFKHQRKEYWEIDNLPESEINEVREIYSAKGFEGELLEQIVETITADKDRWVDVMMKDELEMLVPEKEPVKAAAATYLSFMIMGVIPLLPYTLPFINPPNTNSFLIASILTLAVFLIIGFMKGNLNQSSRWKSTLETVILGGAAATLAYFAGDFIENLIQ